MYFPFVFFMPLCIFYASEKKTTKHTKKHKSECKYAIVPFYTNWYDLILVCVWCINNYMLTKANGVAFKSGLKDICIS